MVILGRLVISILYDIVCVGVCALSSSDWYVVEVHNYVVSNPSEKLACPYGS